MAILLTNVEFVEVEFTLTSRRAHTASTRLTGPMRVRLAIRHIWRSTRGKDGLRAYAVR